MDFVSAFTEGFSLSLFLQKIVLLLVCTVLFSSFILREWGSAFRVFLVFIVSYAAVLGLVVLDVIYLDKRVITSTMYTFILVASLLNVFTSPGSSSGRRNKNRRSNGHKYLNTLAGVAGVISSFYIQNGYIGRKKVSNINLIAENLSINLGILAGMLILIAAILFLGTLFTVAFGVKKKEWVLFATGISVGIVLQLFFNLSN